MKKTFFSLAAIAVLTLAGGVSAATFAGGQNYSLGNKQVINDDLYAAGNQVIVSGKVNEDAIIAGANVLVNGQIGQGLIAAGGTINVLSEIGGSARLAGGQVIVGGNIKKDVVVIGGTAQVLSGIEIGRDAVLAGRMILMDGNVAGKLDIKGEQVEINGIISGNVKVVAAKSLKIGKNAVIKGNLEYSAPFEAQIESGAVVKGETSFTAITRDGKRIHDAQKTLWGILGVLAFAKLLTLLVTGLLLIALFGKWAAQVVNRAYKGFGWEILRGLAFLVVAPVAAILLMITVIGIFPAIVISLVYALAMIIGGAMAGVLLGALLWKWIYQSKDLVVDWKSAAAGITLLWLVALIPFVGWIVTLLLFLATLGAIAFLAYEKMRTK